MYSQPLELVLFLVINSNIKYHKGFYYPQLLNNHLFNYLIFLDLTTSVMEVKNFTLDFIQKFKGLNSISICWIFSVNNNVLVNENNPWISLRMITKATTFMCRSPIPVFLTFEIVLWSTFKNSNYKTRFIHKKVFNYSS